MADKPIYVEFDYENIFLVDPNSVTADDGGREDRYVQQEKLVMYANLECKLSPRSKLVYGVDNNQLGSSTVTIGRINFLKPGGKDFLENNYLGETLGTDEKVNAARAKNYQQQKNSEFFNFRDNITDNPEIIDNGFLGITNIQVRTNASHVPTITMTLVDVRGRAMFEQGNNSPYAAFFTLPYPVFYLTMKGYYGKAVKYPILLQKFNSSYDSSSGNFIVTLTFITYKYGPFGDITMGEIMALPHMYTTKFTTTSQTNSSNSSNSQVVETQTSQRGFQKMVELYDRYRNGDNPYIKDLPNITLQELKYRLDNFVKDILDNSGKVDLQPLTDCDTYLSNLEKYQGDVYYYKGSSWFDKYIDTANYYIDKNTKRKCYSLKSTKESDLQVKSDSIAELEKIILKYNDLLNASSVGINSNIKVEDFMVELSIDEIDLESTFKSKNGKQPTEIDITALKETAINFFKNGLGVLSLGGNNLNTGKLFIFDPGDPTFIYKTNELKRKVVEKRQELENTLSEKLVQILENPNTGIGFKPTIRNIIAVLVVSVEAFYSLLDDVHTRAFEKRNEKGRISQYTENDVNCNNTSQPIDDAIVYPWPLFTVKKTGLSGNTNYEIDYPGDPKYQNIVQSYDYTIWPEVEFVEEFANAFAQRESLPNPFVTNQNENKDVNRLSLSTFDSPIKNAIFYDKQESKFFYEIIERIILHSYYQGLDRDPSKKTQIINFVSDAISKSIIESIGGTSPFLTQLLTDYKFDIATFNSFLQHISNNGNGESWNKYIRDIYVTEEVSKVVETPTKIYKDSFDVFSEPKPDFNNTDQLVEYFKGTTNNQYTFSDTFPFISDTWLTQNVSNGKSVNNYDLFNNTNQSILFNTSLKTITNFSSVTDVNYNRPVTNFNIRVSQQVDTTNFSKDFYTNLIADETQVTNTVGNVVYENYNNLMSQAQCTSIFNTPFFINAIQYGVGQEKNGAKYPYKEASFLFLNSLPLATLREKYKNFQPNNGQSTQNKNYTELDYIASTFRKFGALHKLPYAWILKYGSIWHRYKTYVETGVDILDNCWQSFNYQLNYDPINSDISRNYTITSTTTNFDITLKKVDTTSLSGFTYEDISLGFYPKVINDFNYFYNGYDLVTQYSTVSQSFSYYYIDGTLKLYSPFSTKISSSKSSYDPTLYLSISNYSCLLKNSVKNDGSYYITPSFGSTVNQLYYEFFNTQTNDLQKNYDVPGTYNGSIRLDWSNPHFGYFDPTNITKPNYTEYFSKILSDTSNQNEFTFVSQNGYSSIEEIFGVFTKEELDLFETEFLLFSKSEKDYNEDTANKNMISEYNNFQMLFKIINKLTSVTGLDSLGVIKNAQQTQFNTKNSTISQFLNKDIILKRANPYDYNRYTVDSFLSTSTNPLVVDPIIFGSYNANTPNAVPTLNGSVTLVDTQTNYPEEWKTLQTHVGFSTFQGINYASSGSTILDFFPVFDIAFTTNNIISLAPIIKLFCSYSIKNPTKSGQDFLTDFSVNIAQKNSLKENILNNTFAIIQRQLPKVKIESIRTNPTNVVSDQLKVEYYDMFKVLNDKWVAGNNFSENSFLESFLFLDKASRDIGDDILVDVFKVKNLIAGVKPETSVYKVIAQILKDHHFVTFTMPSYINFYNRANNEGPQESAQLMFGNYLEVDYSQTSTKFVNILSEDPSGNLGIQTKQNGFCDDGFQLERAQNNPNVRLNTSNGEQSNKVVGFAVDFGLQRQQMFYNLNLAQDVGKSTSESLAMEYNLAQLTTGQKSQTQNVGLFNLYKNRSYSCTVQCMGNATIQPTMYFSLRNVPMFSGPYLILEVNHSISPGQFETTFSGVRQKIFTLKNSQNFLASLKMELGKNFYNEIKRQKDEQSKSASTVTQQNTQTTNSVQENPENKNNQTCEPNTAYKNYVNVTGDSKTLGYNRVIEEINLIVNNDLRKQAALFTIIYLSNNSNNNIKFFNNNLTNVNLNRKWSGDLPNKFEFNKEYSCLNFGNQVNPVVKFPNISYNLQFMDSYLKNYYADLQYSTDVTIVEELTKFYIKYWSLQSQQNDAYYDNYISTNASEYSDIRNKVQQAYTILNPVNLNPAPTGTTQNNTGNTLTNNIQTPPLTSNYQYTISNPPMFEELTISINPDIDGPRVIFLVDYNYNITAPCSEGTGNDLQFSNNYISSNGQTFNITAEDLLEETDCTGSGSQGVYEFQITIYTRPVLPGGQTDTTRSDYYKTYPVTMTF